MPGRSVAELNDRIREIFRSETFETVTFPEGPFDVPRRGRRRQAQARRSVL